jgi:hypothetical protein
MDPTSKVLHRGWITKEGQRVASWKRRFFVLRGDKRLFYMKELGHTYEQACGVLDISSETELSWTTAAGKPNAFVIVNGSRTMYCHCDSLKEAQAWMEALVSLAGAREVTKREQQMPQKVPTLAVLAQQSSGDEYIMAGASPLTFEIKTATKQLPPEGSSEKPWLRFEVLLRQSKRKLRKKRQLAAVDRLSLDKLSSDKLSSSPVLSSSPAQSPSTAASVQTPPDTPQLQWTIYRRFSDFQELMQALTTRPIDPIKEVAEDFPSRRLALDFSTIDAVQVEYRRVSMQNFLQEVCLQYGRIKSDPLSLAAFKKFSIPEDVRDKER